MVRENGRGGVTLIRDASRNSPFCYLGLRKLDLGLETFQSKNPLTKIQYTRVWHPYFLDAKLNSTKYEASVISKEEYYHRRYGVEWYKWAKPTMRQWSNDVGLDIIMTGNLSSTVRSHRLFEFALSHKVESQDALVRHVFDEYFSNEKDCGDSNMLAKCAEEVGLFTTTAAAKEWIEGDELLETVFSKAKEVKKDGVGSVPRYLLTLFDGEHNTPVQEYSPSWNSEELSRPYPGVFKRLVVAGSQDKDEWVKTLEGLILQS